MNKDISTLTKGNIVDTEKVTRKMTRKSIHFRYKEQTTGDMVDTPYAADRATNTIYYNPKLIKKLTLFERKFWIMHEKGHIILDTDDEIKADNFAFDSLAGTEYRSLKQMIEAEEFLLDSGSAGHEARIENLYRRAIDWDKQHPMLNKATDREITASGRAVNTASQTTGTLMIGLAETMFSGTQTKDNSQYMMIVAIALIAGLFYFLKD